MSYRFHFDAGSQRGHELSLMMWSSAMVPRTGGSWMAQSTCWAPCILTRPHYFQTRGPSVRPPVSDSSNKDSGSAHASPSECGNVSPLVSRVEGVGIASSVKTPVSHAQTETSVSQGPQLRTVLQYRGGKRCATQMSPFRALDTRIVLIQSPAPPLSTRFKGFALSPGQLLQAFPVI